MLFRKTKYLSSGSLSAAAWKRFRKNRLGFGSLIFILLATLVALLGYLITPDPTPFANDQYLELGLKKPGFRVRMLMVRKNQEPVMSGFFHTMLFGKKSDYLMVPILDYRFDGADLVVREYSDETGTPVELSFNVADIVYPLESDTTKPSLVNGFLVFRDIDGRVVRRSLNDLSVEALTGHIVTKTFILGTDRFGRDVLSQLIIGTRVSLAVGFISVFISLVIGILVGSVGGYYRGWIDHVIVWFINVVWSIPTLLLVIAITFALGKGFWQVFVAVGLTMWVEVARVVRGQVLSIREKEFVEAGRALGFSDFRIIVRHILPNIMGVVIVIAAANFASAILLEAGLSFLGIGVQPPIPSWGAMIKENYGTIILDSAYLAIFPGIAIMLMVLAFMLMGNALRDALDVKTSAV